MLENLNQTLIIHLANILMDNQADTKVIIKSLESICLQTSFDCGLVYERDFLDQFCLLEHYQTTPTVLRQNFAASEYSKKEHAYLTQKSISYITKNPQNTPLETRLLDLFCAASLIIHPLLNEHSQANGLVVFVCTQKKAVITAAEIDTLSVASSILGHYVGLRIYQHKLTQTQTTLESILDNTGIDIYVNDFNTHEILYVNKSMAAPYGGCDNFIGRKCFEVLFSGQTTPCTFCPQERLIDEQGLPTKVYSWDYHRPFDGEWFRVFSATFHWTDGRLAHVVSSANITDNKINEALVEYIANYDQLTKLPNRRMLLKECELRIDRATATEQGYLLFFDIDGFKSVNDNFGHDAGDEILIQIGNFFSNIPVLKDSIYRNGGDEFVAILGGEKITKDNVKNLGGFIHARFREPWNLKKGTVYCNTSIGVSCYPEDGTTGEVLLQKADEAMYKVKKMGGGKLLFCCQL